MKLIILFISIIILLTIIINCKHNNLDVNHFNIVNAKNIIVDNEYFYYFNELDLKLRNCSSRNECKRKYKNSVLTFNQNEIGMLENIVKSFKNMLDDKFKKIFKELKFIRVKNEIEYGLPHTHDKAIIFSSNIFNYLFEKYKLDKNFLINDLTMIQLISHEQFHIFQRLNSNLIDDLYTNYWNLIKLEQELPAFILNVNRSNPDALPNNNWLINLNNSKNKYILPLCIYNTEGSLTSIRSTKNVYVEVELVKGKYVFSKDFNLLSENEEFKEYFGEESSNNYHPNELSASLFEEIVSYKIGKKNKLDNPAFNKMLEFLSNNDLL